MASKGGRKLNCGAKKQRKRGNVYYPNHAQSANKTHDEIYNEEKKQESQSQHNNSNDNDDDNVRFHLNDDNLNAFNKNNQYKQQSKPEIGEDDIVDDDIMSVQTSAYYQKQNKYINNNHIFEDNYEFDNDKQRQLWRKIAYSNDLKHKIGTIQKYGYMSRCKGTQLIRYGLKILELDPEGNYIALYEGNIDDWWQWFDKYIGRNFKHDLNVFSRVDLFGVPMVCGVDIRKDAELGFWTTRKIIRYGWLDGLKYIVEKLKINHITAAKVPQQNDQIRNNFDMLVDAAYYLHDDILKYLLIENNFYKPFNITTKVNKYNETLWQCAKNGLINIIQPNGNTPWFHCLQNIHYAPDLIKAIHGNSDNNDNKNDDGDDEKENFDNDENESVNCTMFEEINNIKFKKDKIVLPENLVEQRLKTIGDLIENKNSVNFKIESCHYGLCADCRGGNTLNTIHFYKPHGVKQNYDCHRLEYIPLKNSEWGLLRFPQRSKNHYLTVLEEKNKVQLSRLLMNDDMNNDNHDDIQLWKIEKLENILNGIWIRIVNKSGYKLIFSWEKDKQCTATPLLSISKDVVNIDKLCRDIFSVPIDNRSTLRHIYYEKYKRFTKKDMLNKFTTELNKYTFWNLTESNNKNKFDIYKLKLKNIAKIIEEYNLKSVNDNKEQEKQTVSPMFNNNNYNNYGYRRNKRGSANSRGRGRFDFANRNIGYRAGRNKITERGKYYPQ